MFPKIGVFPPKSSILIGFSLINHPFWGTIIFGNTPVDTEMFAKVVVGFEFLLALLSQRVSKKARIFIFTQLTFSLLFFHLFYMNSYKYTVKAIKIFGKKSFTK